MARLLLVSGENCDGSAACGFSWYIVIVCIAGALGLSFALVALWKLWAFRNGLRRGKLAAHQVLAEGVQCSDLVLVARCPVLREEFKQQECPVCLVEVRRRGRWAAFPCSHGLCTSCLWGLIRAKQLESSCPLCRLRLFQPPATAGVQLAAAAPAGASPTQQPQLTAAAPGLAAGTETGPSFEESASEASDVSPPSSPGSAGGAAQQPWAAAAGTAGL